MRTNIFSTISITALAALAIGFSGTAQAAPVTQYLNNQEAAFDTAAGGVAGLTDITFSTSGTAPTNTQDPGTPVPSGTKYRPTTTYSDTVNGSYSADGATFTSSISGTSTRSQNDANPGNALSVSNLFGWSSPALQANSGDLTIALPTGVTAVGLELGNQTIFGDFMEVTLSDGEVFYPGSAGYLEGAPDFLGYVATSGDIASISFNQPGAALDVSEVMFNGQSNALGGPVTSTPEPSQTAAFGIGAFGLLALGYRARRRGANAI